MQRTDWAEKFVESFSSIPLTAECVYHSPKYIDRGKEKEVCDLLIILRGKGILISMKAQQDPCSKNREKQQCWTIKNAKNAFDQAKGALKTIANKSYWCQHFRRGRIEFNPGEIQVTNVVVLTELFNDFVELSSNSLLVIDDIPVTYLSINDFLNLIDEIRTFPDLSAYFMARRILPVRFLLLIGNEYSYYKYYLQNDESFREWNTSIVVKSSSKPNFEWQDIQNLRLIKKKNASLIEFVSDSLATRNENFSEGLESYQVGQFDESNQRRNYLLMQEELCDLSFNERALLGEQFNSLLAKVKNDNNSESLIYAAFYTESKPDFVYVIISSKGYDRNHLIEISGELIFSAIKTYKKSKGLVISDHNHERFEVQLVNTQMLPSDEEKLNISYFDHLKVFDIQV